jgi:ssRNA-specific RNase YbeY (16S rRNA maturation enzyme)
MKGGNSGANESDLDKNNILKPNFDTLTEEGHKAFEAYRAYFKEQAKSTDELFHRLIEERDGKKLNSTSINPSSSTCAISFAQTNPPTSGASVGGTSMLNPLV